MTHLARMALLAWLARSGVGAFMPRVARATAMVGGPWRRSLGFAASSSRVAANRFGESTGRGEAGRDTYLDAFKSDL
jgi:hypothetical protein